MDNILKDSNLPGFSNFAKETGRVERIKFICHKGNVSYLHQNERINDLISIGKCSKLFWFVLAILGLAGTIWQVEVTIGDYFKYPTSITVRFIKTELS